MKKILICGLILCLGATSFAKKNEIPNKLNDSLYNQMYNESNGELVRERRGVLGAAVGAGVAIATGTDPIKGASIGWNAEEKIKDYNKDQVEKESKMTDKEKESRYEDAKKYADNDSSGLSR